MKVYYLVLVSAFCVWNNPVQSQWFYSHYTQFAPQPLPYTHFIPQQTYNFAPSPPQVRQPPPTSDYRGFGYHTNYQDGASSTVYFVTGPEAFSGFRKTFGKAEAPRARNLASDITDSNAVPDINAYLQNILQPAEFQQLFDSRSAGFVNFYYPADTVPLIDINNGTVEPTISPTSAATATTTVTTSEEATTISNIPEREAEGAESIVDNTRLRFNVIEDTSNTSTTVSTTSTTTTEAATTETSTETTENPETTTIEESTTVV